MSSYKTEVRNLTYNAETQHFDAIVVFHEMKETTKYPCSIACPIDADFEILTERLLRDAKIKRATNRHSLVSSTPSKVAATLTDIAQMARQLAYQEGIRAA